MNPRLLLLLMLSLSLLTGCRTSLPVSVNGQTSWRIVLSDVPAPAEETAARELATFLNASTGATFEIVREAEVAPHQPSIYVGKTDVAVRHGLQPDSLPEEGWLVTVRDDQLIVLGGSSRGTLYAAYELLEQVAGVRFLTVDYTHVPVQPSLSVPASLDLRGAPTFSRRDWVPVGGGTGQPPMRDYQVRRRINAFANADKQIGAEYGWSLMYGSPYSTHVHHRYVEDFPEAFDKEVHFALDWRGNRTYPTGQICMSHPEVRQSMIACLRTYIQRDRQTIDEAGSGEPYPRFYSLTPDDGAAGQCFCEGCTALAENHQSYSGVVLDFTNEIAAAIAEDYPDIIIRTDAYIYYRTPPVGIVPRDNVIVYIAQLGAEFNTTPKRDAMRSMLHPLNEGPRQEWEGWGKVAHSLGVHDYWIPWQQQIQWPHANLQGLADNMRLYHRAGLKHYFTENEIFGSRLHTFVDLQLYLGSQLMVDPYLEVEPVIEEFMTLVYGPAAEPMRELLDYLLTRQEEESGYLAQVPPQDRAYFDRAFFLRADELLSKAEALVADQPLRLAHVRQERLAFDETMLALWYQLNEPEPLPFSRQAIADRLAAQYQAAYEKYGGWGATGKELDDQRLTYLRNMPAIPERFAGQQVIDVCPPMLRLRDGKWTAEIEDPDAVMGTAWALTHETPGNTADHTKLPEFGVSDVPNKFLDSRKLPREEIPRDEQYHWYLAGTFTATPTTYIYAHHSWRLAQRLFMAYNGALPDQHTYQAWLSIKLQGPDYVPGSTKTNMMAVDRMILVRQPSELP